jgi:hypothetical protein
MPPFVSMNGLAGDVVVIGGIISRREAEISSLQERVIELEHDQEEEAETIEGDIKRRIKDLEKQLKATTREREKKLKDSQTAHLKCKGPIIERIEELQQLNDHDRSLIAPIRKLPAELLGYVFQHHVDLDNSPWVLTFVSKSWRHTAITTPALWVHLSLFSVEHRRRRGPYNPKMWQINGHGWYSKGRRVVCHNLSELNTIVSRAGSLPLDIHVAYRNDNASMVQYVLGDTAIARRIGSLVIDASDPIGMGPMHDVPGITVGSFPLLHTLALFTVPEKVHEEILERISSSSPHLKHLTTHQNISLSLDSPFWSNLRSLNLSGRSTSGLFNNLIPHLGNLETLEDCPPCWPDDSTPEVKLARLTTLGVRCVPEGLCRLQLPALIRLSIEALWNHRPKKKNEVPSISLPALESLEVKATACPSWLAMLSAPSMRVFAFREVDKHHGEKFSLFPNCNFPAVQDFTFHYPCTDQVAISALECVPNVKKVAVSCSRLREPWGLEILQRLADAENTLCPNMTQFTLGSFPNSRVVMNKGSAKARARRAIKNRMERGVEMDHFEIHFEARGEIIQYA